MPALVWIIAAAAAWYFLRPEGKFQGDDAIKGGALPASGSTVTVGGKTYRVVGEPNDAGLVPVSYQPPAGTLAPAVVTLYDPRLGRTVSTTDAAGGGVSLTVMPRDVM